MFSSTFATLALVAASLLTPATASNSTYSLRRSGGSVSATCANVAGTAYGYKFDFGCLCKDDVPSFCNNNGINSYFQGLISGFLDKSGKTYSYPSNAQPTCDGYGGFNCGHLKKIGNQCGESNTNTCDPNQCFSNGGCCPRGQTYSNGKCCGSSGCNRNSQTCTPILQCTTYTDNNICCPAGTSGWKGQKSRCCPVGQIESSDGTDCICPAGKKEDKNDPNKCVDGCPSKCSWGATKCCPDVATEKDGVCVCPFGTTLSGDSTQCIDKCVDKPGFTWCNTVCCPKGSSEDAKGNCVCTDKQAILNKDKNACVDRCPNGNFYSSICCNGDAKEIGGKCVCTDKSKTYTGDGDKGSCTDSCPTGCKWGPKQGACCPLGSEENAQGACVCTDSSKELKDNQCKPKCTAPQIYNAAAQKCCPAGSGTSCACANTNQAPHPKTGICTDICGPGYTYGPNIDGPDLNSKCCPPGSKPDSTGRACQCNDPTQKLTGTSPSQTCAPRCPKTGETWAPVQKTCCPANSVEIAGVCQCTDNTKMIKDGSCQPRCTTGTWGGMGKRCCPPGSTEDCYGVCQCTDPTKKITGTDDSAACTPRCADKPSDWNWCTSQCCPPGSSEKYGKCVCDSNSQKFNKDNTQCVDICPSGQYNAGSRCCPNDTFQWGNTCVCKKILSGYTLSSDGSKCVPGCNYGSTYQDTRCCPNYLDEKNGQCVCPNDGDIDTGGCCQPKCPSGQQYNSATGKCDPVCANGFYYKKGYNGKGFCCTSNETACNTRCCPAPTIEIGDTGVCCTEGSQVVDGRCVTPSAKSPKPYRRHVGAEIQLTKKSSSELYFGLEANKDGKLCPSGLAACPVDGGDKDLWECVDAQSDLQSCGGCPSLGSGEDCSAIPGARWMGCNVGKCEVYSCMAGWKLVKGRCERV